MLPADSCPGMGRPGFPDVVGERLPRENFCKDSWGSGKSKWENPELQVSMPHFEPQEPSVGRMYVNMEVGFLHVESCKLSAFFE